MTLSDEVQKPKITHSARRINVLAKQTDAQRYLEIGVAGGGTFFAVEIPKKVAVDPKFRFDWRSRQSETVQFFEVTSDEWFLNHSDASAFDLIFLDGLHTFEQTFRDFCNSMSISHNKTIWIIDDTVPSDVYSAWPDQREAISFRQQGLRQIVGEGRKLSGQWHGDVFKMIFAIHDFFPTMSYCTLVTGGNPQTIVWRSNRTDFVPVFNNLEAISRMNYFDFKKNFDVIRPVSEGNWLPEIFSRTEGN